MFQFGRYPQPQLCVLHSRHKLGNIQLQITNKYQCAPISKLLIVNWYYWIIGSIGNSEFMHTMQDTLAVEWPSMNSVRFPHSDTVGL
jgi:hypothetical protein